MIINPPNPDTLKRMVEIDKVKKEADARLGREPIETSDPLLRKIENNLYQLGADLQAIRDNIRHINGYLTGQNDEVSPAEVAVEGKTSSGVLVQLFDYTHYLLRLTEEVDYLVALNRNIFVPK